MIRTHDAGSLRPTDTGTTVTLAGWVARRRDHGGVTFLDLRDASGSVQVVCRDLPEVHALRSEWCVTVAGAVTARTAGNVNPNLATGDVEVVATAVTVLSESEPVPFPIDGADEIESGVDEMLRWKHRYLDLRRAGPPARSAPGRASSR